MSTLNKYSYMLFRSPIAVSLFILSLVLVVISLSSAKTSAAYDPNRLIDDQVFLDANSMSRDDIQNFLVARGGGIANRSFQLNCYGPTSQERQWYTAVGAPCDQIIPASHIIYYASQIYGASPRVVLATLQKEQGLITAVNPTDWQINQAMGYACPTTGNCAGNSTFSYQIDSGVWVLRWHFERARGNNTWWRASTGWTCGTAKSLYSIGLYPGNSVTFIDTDGVPYRTVQIANAATASFYCYTPHTYNNHPNGAANSDYPVGTLCYPTSIYSHHYQYGNIGRCYTGSFNFVHWYERWFGSTYANDTLTPHPNGTLVSDGQSVFLIENGFRRHMNPWVFTSYNYQWSQVKPASSGDKQLPLGSPVLILAPGTLFSSTNTPLYVMDHEGGALKKRHVSYEAFIAMGFRWSDVMSVPPSLVPSATHSQMLFGNTRPSGNLVVDPTLQAVHYIDAGSRKYVSPAAFISNNFSWNNVRQATPGDLTIPVSGSVDLRRGSLFLSNNTIFVIDVDSNGGFRRPVGPWECFAERWRYTMNDLVVAPIDSLPARQGPLSTC